MKIYCQRDPLWASKRIGTSNLTVGRYGCTISACAMLSTLFGGDATPATLASRKENFNGEGLVVWPMLSVPKIKFEWRQHGRDDKKILASLKDPSKGVILQVGNGAHWCLAVRKCYLSSDYVIIDPWTGKYGTACGDYGNITGSSHFIKA